MSLDVDEDRRVVDQDIDAAEAFHRFGCHVVRVLFFGDIHLERESITTGVANFIRDGLAIKNIGDDDRGTLLRQLATVCRADVSRAARDDGNFPRQPHRTLLECWSVEVLEYGVLECWSNGVVE